MIIIIIITIIGITIIIVMIIIINSCDYLLHYMTTFAGASKSFSCVL